MKYSDLRPGMAVRCTDPRAALFPMGPVGYISDPIQDSHSDSSVRVEHNDDALTCCHFDILEVYVPYLGWEKITNG